MNEKIGFVGVGRIGTVMASNILKAGYELTVYDVSKEAMAGMAKKGARTAGSPQAVAESADIIEIAVRDDDQVMEVVAGENGILNGARQGSVIIIHSTIEPETAVKVGELARAKGVGVLDAPMSGGTEGATAGTLLYMVGGDAALFERCKPIFSASGTTIMHMGPIGSGAKTRIVHHVIMGLNRFAADEGMKLAQAYGLDVDTVCKAVHGGEAQSYIIDRYLEKYKEMTTSGQYRIAGIALRVGYEKGIPMLGAALFQQLYLPTKPK